MEDQITCIFFFKITPTKIVQTLSSSKAVNNNPPQNGKNIEQSILFKLGNSEGKCQRLNQSVQIKTSVLYSRTLNKFCPIKGLVKIYDKNKDGHQMISCVGAFNTDQLLNSKKWKQLLSNEGNTQGTQCFEEVELVRNIGPCILTMTITIIKENIDSQRKTVTQNIKVEEKRTKQRIISTPTLSKQIEKSPKLTIKNTQKSPSLNLKNTEFQKLQQLQNQLAQSNNKNNDLQRLLHSKNVDISNYMRKSKQFIQLLTGNQSLNKLAIEVNSQKGQLTIKYNKNTQKIKEQFEQFMQFLINQLQYCSSSVQCMKKQQQKKIESSDKLQYQIKILSEQKKTLQGMNQYLQDKDHQMESIIQQKQLQIENMKKIINANNQELDILEQKNHEQKLTVDEIKQQIANLTETIQNYRRKYGDLKEVKDRALQRDLRECLHWIDQYREDEVSMLQDQTTNNSMFNSNSDVMVDSQTNNAMTSLMMKSIDHIQDMPVEEISQIRREVVNVLKRLDQLLARNNI